MLQAIRGKAGSWVVKILFGFLILSFAVWGVGDILRDSSANSKVAEVGEIEITVADVDRTVRREVDAIRRFGQTQFDIRTAIGAGLHYQALRGLVGDALLDLEARDLGLVLSNAYISDAVIAQPMFHDPVTGRFDRDRFLQILAANGLTEGAFVETERWRLAREWVQTGVQLGATIPRAQAEALHRFRFQTRVADVMAMSFADTPVLAEPSEQDLTAYHEGNADLYSSPERRRFTLVAITPEDLLDEVDVSQADVEAEYEARLDSYRQPERRTFVQVVVPDQDVATQIHETAQDGAGLEAAVADIAPDAALIPIDQVTRSDMIAPELGEAGFALAEGEVAEPVSTAFGWHVLELQAIAPETVRSLDEARDEIDRALRLDLAGDAAFGLTQTFLDELAGGSNLDQAADRLGLQAHHVPAVDRNGVDAGGSTIEVPAQADALALAFELDDGQESDLEETDDGIFYIVKVEQVSPAALRPLGEVRETVLADWQRSQRRDAAVSAADEAARQITDGTPMADVATGLGVEVETTEPLLRDGSNAGELPNTLIGQVFAAQPGETVTAEGQDGVFIARVSEVVAPEPDETAINDILASSRNLAAADLLAQFVNGLEQQRSVDVDISVIDRYYAASEAAGAPMGSAY